MKKYFYCVVLISLFSGFRSSAQQLPQFSHYGFNGMYISPGYAGITNKAEVNGIFRKQWAGYQGSFDGGGAPTTGLFSFSVPVFALKGGIGGHVLQDQLGDTKITNAALGYAFHIKAGEGKIGIGAQGLVTRISKGNYRPNEPGDPSVPENTNDRKFDAGAGVWYESEKFYLGAGVNNLLQAKYVFEDSLGSATTGAGSVTGERHIQATAGYNFPVSESLIITPTAIGKYDLNNLSFEGGLRGTLNNKYWLGFGYRYQEALTGMLGGFLTKENTSSIGLRSDM